jgi:hypothetical protein
MAASANNHEIKAYYVRQNGSDVHDGVSEETAYKTLTKAVESVKNGAIKRIIVVGTLDEKSESRAPCHLPHDPDGKSVFYIVDSGTEEITISGREEARLSGTYEHADFNSFLLDRDAKRVIRVAGNSHIRFEHITIAGGNANPTPAVGSGQVIAEGGGILVSGGAVVTLGEGTVIKRNYAVWRGGGISVCGGSVIIDGGMISGNVSLTEGGGISLCARRFPLVDNRVIDAPLGESAEYYYPKAALKIIKGQIVNNISDKGGGISVLSHEASETADIEMAGGEITGNHASSYGGGVFMDSGKFEMSGGIIRGNKTDRSLKIIEFSEVFHGGGVYTMLGVFIFRGGSITDNEARFGGGVMLISSILVMRDKARLCHNQASKKAGGVFLDEGCRFTREGGEIAGNTPEDIVRAVIVDTVREKKYTEKDLKKQRKKESAELKKHGDRGGSNTMPPERRDIISAEELFG